MIDFINGVVNSYVHTSYPCFPIERLLDTSGQQRDRPLLLYRLNTVATITKPTTIIDRPVFKVFGRVSVRWIYVVDLM